MYKKILSLLVAYMIVAPTLLAQEDSVRFTVNVRRLKQAGAASVTGSPIVGDSLYALIFSGATATGLGNKSSVTYIGRFNNLTPSDSLLGPKSIGLGAVNITQISYKLVYSNGTRAISGAFPTGENGNIRYEGDPNKTVDFSNPAAETRNVVRYWDNDSTQFAQVIRNVNFRADMTGLLAGGFDNATDSIYVLGAMNGWSRVTGQGLVSEGFGSVTYSKVISVTANPNTNVGWKFRAFSTLNPAPFLDGGWEQGSDRQFNVGTSNSDTVAGGGNGLVPNIGTKQRKSFNVRFVVNTVGRRNINNVSLDSLRTAGALDGDLAGVPYGVYLAGEGVFGDWPQWGNFRTLNAASGALYARMTPSATFGAGFFEVTRPVNFLTVGPFKYSVFYRGIDTTGSYLDNEAGFGVNKIALFTNEGTVVGGNYTVIGIFGQGDGGLSVGNDGRKVENFELSQNYPNPFNPSTSIKFSVPTASDVRLEVFNILGQKVATLVNTRLNAGSYTQNFNAINMSSGVYFYRLQAGSFNKTMKMTLVK